MAFKFHRGDHVVDMISGFKGMVTARQDHITQCNRYFVEPPVNEKGELPTPYWFDEAPLLLDTTKTRFVLAQPKDQPPG